MPSIDALTEQDLQEIANKNKLTLYERHVFVRFMQKAFPNIVDIGYASEVSVRLKNGLREGLYGFDERCSGMLEVILLDSVAWVMRAYK